MLIEEALRALLTSIKVTEIDVPSATYDEQPFDEADDWKVIRQNAAPHRVYKLKTF